MPVSTDKLVLTARQIGQLSPAFKASWNVAPTKRYASVPFPSLSSCPANIDELSGTVTDPNPLNRGFFQWISPPLNGAQTFHTTDTALIAINAYDAHPLPAGHDIGTRIHMRIVDSTGNDRGSSLITFATATGTSPILTVKTLTTFYNSVLENNVDALDGDRIVVEAGILRDSHGIPGDNGDTHGPGHVFADDDGRVTFSFPVSYKDESVCSVGSIGIGPILGAAGPGNVLAPSCDNTVGGG